MTTTSPNDFHAKLIAQHGEEDAKVILHLLTEYMQLIDGWRTFNFLFSGDERRISLINEVSPQFFGLVSSSLWDMTLVRLRRLLDKNKTGKDKNVGIDRLLDLVPPEKRQLQEEANVDARFAFERVKPDVNKAIVHNDLGVFLKDERFSAKKFEITGAVRAMKAAIDVYLHENPEDAAENFPIKSDVKDEQAMLLKLFVGNLKIDDMWREQFEEDMRNGSQAKPSQLIPDWLFDSEIRNKPF